MRWAFALIVGVVAACSAPLQHADTAVRVVSLDACADQAVLSLLEPAKIAAVSREVDRGFSAMRNQAAGIKRVRGSVEDILALRPDVVVRAYGGGAAVAGALERAGVRVVQLGFASTLNDVQTEMARVSAELGRSERGAEIAATMAARLGALQAGSASPPTALYMTPGGVTTGEGSLVHELMQAAGLANFQTAPGWAPLPLEHLAREQPDMIAAAFYNPGSSPPWAWSAARHPIAQRQLHERPVAMLDAAWTACGAWSVVSAVEAMAAVRATVSGAP